MRDNKTIDYYNINAKAFCDSTQNTDMSYCQNRFLKYLGHGSSILDAGCGSGRDSKVFLDKGYNVTSIDASEQICKIASEYIERNVECICFEEISYENTFDGIWACASLLHITKDKLPNVLRKVYRALKKEGVLYASFKYGNNEEIKDNRYFSNFNEEQLSKLIGNNTDFEIVEIFITNDARPEREHEQWINIILKKGIYNENLK